MRPKERRETGHPDLFRARLDQIVDLNHPLVKLSGAIDWSFLEERCGAVYTDEPGRPPLPTRLMAGLAILKHMHDLSDEVLCERWIETPSWQLFCGEEFFQHTPPFDRSSLTRWRQRMGEERLIALIRESLAGEPCRRALQESLAGEPCRRNPHGSRQARRLPAGDRGHHGPGESDHLPDRRQADAPRPRAPGALGPEARRHAAPDLRAGGQGGPDPAPALRPRQAVQASQQSAPACAPPARPNTVYLGMWKADAVGRGFRDWL